MSSPPSSSRRRSAGSPGIAPVQPGRELLRFLGRRISRTGGGPVRKAEGALGERVKGRMVSTNRRKTRILTGYRLGERSRMPPRTANVPGSSTRGGAKAHQFPTASWATPAGHQVLGHLTQFPSAGLSGHGCKGGTTALALPSVSRDRAFRRGRRFRDGGSRSKGEVLGEVEKRLFSPA
jgi:hypothetical protein